MSPEFGPLQSRTFPQCFPFTTLPLLENAVPSSFFSLDGSLDWVFLYSEWILDLHSQTKCNREDTSSLSGNHIYKNTLSICSSSVRLILITRLKCYSTFSLQYYIFQMNRWVVGDTFRLFIKLPSRFAIYWCFLSHPISVLLDVKC